VRFQFFVGSSVQKGNFNSITHLLMFVKSLENHNNSKNCKLNFARLLVMSHLISEEEPSASHMCTRISLHTYDRRK
jgi:hypothetical protein